MPFVCSVGKIRENIGILFVTLALVSIYKQEKTLAQSAGQLLILRKKEMTYLRDKLSINLKFSAQMTVHGEYFFS